MRCLSSATSETIIFMFLGMVLVKEDHVWHTGFILWTLLLCFVARFISECKYIASKCIIYPLIYANTLPVNILALSLCKYMACKNILITLLTYPLLIFQQLCPFNRDKISTFLIRVLKFYDFYLDNTIYKMA